MYRIHKHKKYIVIKQALEAECVNIFYVCRQMGDWLCINLGNVLVLGWCLED